MTGAARSAGVDRGLRLVVMAVALFVAAAPVQAQETGTLRGTVALIETGGPVDGAVVLLLGTGAFTFTDNGAFEFTNVPAGGYVVTAQREHLTTGEQAVTVVAGETASVDFMLGLSAVREEVTVTAEATVGVEATLQAFNAALYRNHTSFIKDLAPEMGRGVRVGYSLRFF